MKKLLITFFLALGLGALWLVQDKFPFLQLRPKHYSVAEIEAAGLRLKFSKEISDRDGKNPGWRFELEPPGPMPLAVVSSGFRRDRDRRTLGNSRT